MTSLYDGIAVSQGLLFIKDPLLQKSSWTKKYNFSIDTSSFMDAYNSRETADRLDDWSAKIDTYSKSQKKLLHYLFSFRHEARVKLRNSIVAKACKLSISTVRRGTDKLVKDGFIFKFRTNGRTSNDYVLAPFLKKGQVSFKVWLSALSKQQQIRYLKDGQLPKKIARNAAKDGDIYKQLSSRFVRVNDALNIIRVFNYNIYNKSSIKNTPIKNTYQNSAYVLDKVNVSFQKYNNFKTLIKMPKSECGNMSNLVVNPDNIEFNKIQQDIIAMFNLNIAQRLKLFAFSKEVLEHSLRLAQQTKSVTFGMFMNESLLFSRRLDITPDWDRYHKLCKYYEVVPERVDVISVSRQTIIKKRESTLLVPLEDLMREIVSWKEKIATFDPKHFLYNEMIGVAKKMLKQVEDEFLERLKIDEIS